MKKNEEPGPRFEWDLVTWSFIAIVLAIVLVFVMLLWPHPFRNKE
jgi:hypothetical protein